MEVSPVAIFFDIIFIDRDFYWNRIIIIHTGPKRKHHLKNGCYFTNTGKIES